MALPAERPVRAELEEGGSLLHLTLARPKGNIIDTAMLLVLREEIARLAELPAVRAVLFSGEGAHFSYGASVEEHLPDRVERMLSELHGLFLDLAGCGRVLLAAVRGQCLGGGLELAVFAHRSFATADARLGQPEIRLGVFAPVASILLPLRIGQAAADDLLLTGRTLSGDEALGLGLVDAVVLEPVEAARAWHREHLLGLSAVALRHAAGAGRRLLHRELRAGLVELERAYVRDLMATHDAREGLSAFLEKRSPRWMHR